MQQRIDGLVRGVAAIAVLLIATCALAQDVIKVGYLPQVHDAANFAVERELGKKYKLEYVKFLRYADAEIALARGDIQLAPLGYATVVGSALRDAEPKYFLVSGMSRGAINVVCRKDVQVKDWADLKGKTMGVLTGGPAELFFDDALKVHGLKGSDVKRVSFTAPGPPLLQAMQAKNIECMAVFEPFAATAVVDGYGYYPPVNLADNSFLGINHAMAINAEFLGKHPELAQEIVNVVVKSTDEYNRDRAKWIADLKGRPDFRPEVVQTGVEHVLLDWNLYLDRTRKLAASMKDLGFIRAVPDDARLAKYFRYDYLTKATGLSEAQVGRTK
jgi:ABC-type nitrate/sulfonate/bicarbonate transport system substrate-binding protein